MFTCGGVEVKIRSGVGFGHSMYACQVPVVAFDGLTSETAAKSDTASMTRIAMDSLFFNCGRVNLRIFRLLR